MICLLASWIATQTSPRQMSDARTITTISTRNFVLDNDVIVLSGTVSCGEGGEESVHAVSMLGLGCQGARLG